MTVSTVNGGVIGMVNALAIELAPIRVNAIHPGIVGDSPFWAGKPDAVLEGRTGHVVDGRSVAEVAATVAGLLEDPVRADELGRAGREWVEREWRWDVLAGRLRELLVGD